MRELIDRFVKCTLIALMGILVLTVVWQVFTRYVLQSPSTYTDELARFLLMWLGLLGAAYYSGQNSHIAIELLYRYVTERTRRKLTILMYVLVSIFVLCVFVIGGGHLVYVTYTSWQITPALQVPMAAVYSIGPLSGLLILYYNIAHIRRIMKN